MCDFTKACLSPPPFVILFLEQPDLSTPHGALGTEMAISEQLVLEILSTPHGALGTFYEGVYLSALRFAFNSTRCIRNGHDSIS
jgi:hypothetical protein